MDDSSGVLSQGLESLSHRGPDGKGLFCKDGIGLAHARLALQDLSDNALQPFISPCGRYALLFNGEVYNFKTLSKRLLDLGVDCKTESDTEVVLNLLIHFGINAKQDFLGMYAIVFVDFTLKQIFLFRDNFGIKPLFYSTAVRHRVFFSSEISPIRSAMINEKFCEGSVLESLRFGYVPAPNTIFPGIKSVCPGELVVISYDSEKTDCSISCFSGDAFDTSLKAAKRGTRFRSVDRKQLIAECRQELIDSVELTLTSDAASGLFLSGGIDSAAILACCLELGRTDVHCYSFGYDFDLRVQDESLVAGSLANRLGFEHSVVRKPMSRESLEHYVDWIVSAFGSPFLNPTTILTSVLAEEASKTCKSVMVGDGADELFGGYPRYQATKIDYMLGFTGPWLKLSLKMLLEIWELTPLKLNPQMMRRVKGFLSSRLEYKLNFQTYTEIFTDLDFFIKDSVDVRQTFISDLFETRTEDIIKACGTVDLQSFVPYNLMDSSDRAGMKHGLECRVPFLNDKFATFALGLSQESIQGRFGPKSLLKEAFIDILGEDFVLRKKQGFNPPIFFWLQDNKEILEFLDDPDSPCFRFLDRGVIKRKKEMFLEKNEDYSMQMWGALVLNKFILKYSEQ